MIENIAILNINKEKVIKMAGEIDIGIKAVKRNDILSYEEIDFLTRLGVEVGVYTGKRPVQELTSSNKEEMLVEGSFYKRAKEKGIPINYRVADIDRENREVSVIRDIGI